MEYRNSGVNTHYGGGIVAGVDRNAGTEVLGSTIASVSDSAAADLTVKAKGTGTLNLGDSSNSIFIGGSTTPYKLVAGVSSFRPPDMTSLSLDVSTIGGVTGISSGDLIVSMDFRQTLSTGYATGHFTATSSNEIKVQFVNPRQSSISGSSGRVRWAYLDRT